MKILVSNDDGIYSKGIYSLSNALKTLGDVIVVAPETEQSAAGHSITMKNPLRINEYYKNGEFFGYAVAGTPADCVKIGIKNILGCKPDLVVSGINNGANTAISIIYSGTVSAAREAAIMNVPSIAVSVADHNPHDYLPSAEVALIISEMVIKNGLPEGTLLNVNVPDLPKEKIKGLKLTCQGKSKWEEEYEERHDPYGKNYYWLKGFLTNTDIDESADQYALRKGFVSVTPVHFDLTDYQAFADMKSWGLNSLKL